MKKLMVIAALALTGVMARAAQVDWYIYSGALPDSGTAYVFADGGTAASMAAYLISGEYTSDADFKAAIASYTGVAVDGQYADGTTLGVGDYMSALVLNSTEEGSTVFYASNISTDGYTYTPPESADLLGIESFATGTVTFKDDPGPVPPPIPEPTSGLLLLLGVAGLALKRRRA